VGILWTAVLLGLAIPAAATLTALVPVPGDGTLGFLTGVAGGVLAYIGAAHLLPEAQSEDTDMSAGLLFAATLLIASVGLIVFHHG
jgi:zinc transporter ZupT